VLSHIKTTDTTAIHQITNDIVTHSSTLFVACNTLCAIVACRGPRNFSDTKSFKHYHSQDLSRWPPQFSSKSTADNVDSEMTSLAQQKLPASTLPKWQMTYQLRAKSPNAGKQAHAAYSGTAKLLV